MISQSKRRWKFNVSAFQTRTGSYKINILGYYPTYFPVSPAFGLFFLVVTEPLFFIIVIKSITSPPDWGIIITTLKMGENDTERLGPLPSKTLEHLHNPRHITSPLRDRPLVPSYAILEDLLKQPPGVPEGSARRGSLALSRTLQPPASPCAASEHPHRSARPTTNSGPHLGPLSSFAIRI